MDHGECEWEGECIKVELIFDRSLIGAGIANKTKLGKQRPLGWGGAVLLSSDTQAFRQ